MIPFVETKHPDYGWIREHLAPSEASGTWSNFAPASMRLEDRLGELLDLPSHRRVIACANGTVALHALVQLYEHLAGRRLRWVVSAFTFHAQRQGPLADAQVLDCDARGYLDPASLAAVPDDAYDGFVVTNLFGSALGVESYEAMAARKGKVLLFDSATCVASASAGKPFGRQGSGEAFSFHHTKPCGFGEGGCAVVPAELEDIFRSLINFGLYKGIDTGALSLNGKMSDVAAAFISDRLRHVEAIRAAHQQQFRRLASVAEELGLRALVDPTAAGGFPNLVCVVFPQPVHIGRLAGHPLVLHKYYRPLESRPRAADLYERLACLPCHAGVAALADGEIARILTHLMS